MAIDGMWTLTDIADELGEPPRRVDYIIKKYRIKPDTRIALTRLFTQQQMQLVKRYLLDIQIRGQR
jgi:hypothetical protein